MHDASLKEFFENLTPVQASSLRRTVLDWRDHWLAESEIQLTRDARSLAVDLEAIHGNRSYYDWVAGPSRRTKRKIEGLIDIWKSELDGRLLEVAKTELRFAFRNEQGSDLNMAIGNLVNGRLSMKTILATDNDIHPEIIKSDWVRYLNERILENSNSFLEVIRLHIRQIATEILRMT